MTRPDPANKGVLRRDSFRLIEQPAVIDCADADHDKGAIAVVPLMDGSRVAGLEIRCNCGASTLVECVYQSEPTP